MESAVPKGGDHRVHTHEALRLELLSFAFVVSVPGFHGGGRRNYWHHFGPDHVDLCDVVSMYGASRRARRYCQIALKGLARPHKD
jgi:hypothetical protein